MMPKIMHPMARAYQTICAGEDPWTVLGNFTNAWYDYAKQMRVALVDEPLRMPEPETEHTRHWAAFCAASVEFLCGRYGVPCPVWVDKPDYVLSTPWYGDNIVDLADTVVLQHRIKTTPAPFARRNVFCGNRLFQNKYELNEWVQEARSKGMSNPRDIWRYAREKETALHGA